MSNFFSVKSLAVIAVLVVILRLFVIQPFIVDGSSMEPNFHNREYILVDKVSYNFSTPQRGQVIVFHPPENPGENYIKRVIGIPGDTIEITGGHVFVNNIELTEPYLSKANQGETEQYNTNGPVKLAADQYFVLGDNRLHSSDSREWGVLPRQNIIGKTWIVLFPLNDLSLVSQPAYAGLSN